MLNDSDLYKHLLHYELKLPRFRSSPHLLDTIVEYPLSLRGSGFGVRGLGHKSNIETSQTHQAEIHDSSLKSA